MNARRGHESPQHLEAKRTLGCLFGTDDWSVFYEQRHADVLLMHHSSRAIIAIEVESSPRNVIRNIQRNHDNACLGTAVVSLNPDQLKSITLKVRRSSNPSSAAVQIFPYTDLGIIELFRWVKEIVEDES